MTPYLTTGTLCKRFGVMPWQILQALRRGYLVEPARLGVYRAWSEADLPRIREALTRAGYLPQQGGAVHV